MKTKTEVLHQDDQAIREARTAYAEAAVKLQAVKTAIEKIVPESITNAEALQQAIGDPVRFIREAVKAKIPNERYGVPVDKDRELANLKLPDTIAVADAVAEFKGFCRANRATHWCYAVENNAVIVDGKKVESALNQYRITAEKGDTAKAEFVRKHRALAEAYEDLRNYAADTYGEVNTARLFDFFNPMACPAFDINRIFSAKDGKIVFNPALTNYVSQFSNQLA